MPERDEVLTLVEPSVEWADEYRQHIQECLALGEDGYLRLFDFYGVSLRDLPGLVARLRAMSEGVDLPPGVVPATTYWLIRDGRHVLGESRLRHRLNANLLHEGGHIGYVIRPSQRRRGYGKQILALTLDKARDHGLERVLLTCNVDNLGSARIIEHGGGQRENEVVSAFSGKLVARYWIAL